MRTKIGRSLHAWKQSLIQDLAGPENVTTAMEAVLDLAVRQKLLLDTLDSWLCCQKSLVNAKKKAVHPVVRERLQMSAHLKDLLQTIGLNRKEKPMPSWRSYLQHGTGEAPGAEAEPKPENGSEEAVAVAEGVRP